MMRLTEYFNSVNVLNLSGILVTLFVGVLSVYTNLDSNLWPVIAVLASAQLICFIVFVNLSTGSRLPYISLFWAEAIFISTLYFLVDTPFVAILSIVWTVQAAELYGPRRASWLVLASFIVLVSSQLYHWMDLSILNAVVNSALFGLLQVFALTTTQRAIRERELHEETSALNRELIATRELLSQTTAQSERVRIARDLHDILGHHMTALILNLEVAKHKAEGKVQEKVEQSLALAKLLLGDLRTAVSELREDDVIDLRKSIDTLVAGIPKLEIDVDFSEAPPIKDVELAETILRCTQEAITNVLRHSSATKCRIAIVGVGDKCVLTVSDNGNAGKKIEPGNGLKGMAERVSVNGGALSWQQTNQGFNLQVELLVESS